MCSIKTLYHSEKGYLVKCRKCAHFQMVFGTVVFMFTLEQLNEFSETVNDYYENYKQWDFRDEKLIRIPTALPHLTFALSVNDIEIISGMLNQALLEMEMEKVFEFKKN